MKIFIATNIKDYIKDFPDLEDEAINAVYDLCEDQDQKVSPVTVRPPCILIDLVWS